MGRAEEAKMRFRSSPVGLRPFWILFSSLLAAVSLSAPNMTVARHSTSRAQAAGKPLTVDRIYSQPSLSGHLTQGLAWTPDAKNITYFRLDR